MAYADYNFYTESYYGDELTESNAAKWLERASEELDAITFHRLQRNYPSSGSGDKAVKKATCAIAEILFRIDVQTQAGSAQKGSDGVYHGAIASLSSGRESVSYASNSAGSTIYAKAAADEAERLKLLQSAAVKYLSGVPDERGVNLLYAGR